MISLEDRGALLDVARRSVVAAVTGGPLPGAPPGDSLSRKGAAFVTLRKHGELRGCIGHVRALEPLWLSVRDMARSAALQDPRFPAVRRDDLHQMTIEISVLSPLRRIRGEDEIEIGRHGLYLVSGVRSGLLLPQVATANQWDARRFLEHTCRKAGLPPRGWKNPSAELYVFEAEIFAEGDDAVENP